MKKSLFLCFLLVGCNHIPPQYPQWPDSPKLGNCPELENAMPTEKLSDLLSTVVKNYEKYHVCAARSQEWQQWYINQKKIYEDAISGKESK